MGYPGKQGPAGIGPGSTLRLGESYAICDLYTAGTIRYNRTYRVVQLCNGEQWLTVSLETKGKLKHRPGKSCRDILDSGEMNMDIDCTIDTLASACARPLSPL
jgi:hypothetical protein